MFVVHLQAGMKAFREKILADTLEGKVKCFFYYLLKTILCNLMLILFSLSKHLWLLCTSIKALDMWRYFVASVSSLASR